MDSFFRVEGFFFAFLNRFANLVILNIIFIISCLPIVTIGPAVSALYQVSLKSVDDAYLRVYKDYTKAFKEQFFPSNLLFLTQCFVLGILGLMLFAVSRFNMILSFPFFIVAAALCLAIPYSFALLSLQKTTPFNQLKTAFYLMLSHVAESILMFGEGLIILVILPLFFPKSLFFILAVGFSIVSYLQALTLKKIVGQTLAETLEISH